MDYGWPLLKTTRGSQRPFSSLVTIGEENHHSFKIVEHAARRSNEGCQGDGVDLDTWPRVLLQTSREATILPRSPGY